MGRIKPEFQSKHERSEEERKSQKPESQIIEVSAPTMENGEVGSLLLLTQYMVLVGMELRSQRSRKTYVCADDR